MLNLRERTQLNLNLPRGRWKTGQISELIKGADQKIRSAKVTVAPHKFLYRALSLLYPIECPDHQVNLGESSQVIDQISDVENESNKNELTDSTRPTCQATVAARQKLKQWLNPDGSFISLGSVADHARRDDVKEKPD